MIPCYLFIIINQPAFLDADADFINLGDVDGGLAKMEEDLSSEGQAGMWARLVHGSGVKEMPPYVFTCGSEKTRPTKMSMEKGRVTT